MPGAAEALYNLFIPIAVASILAAVAVGIGALILNPFLSKTQPPFIDSFALGTLVISLVTYAWGLFGWMGIYARLILALPLALVGIAGWITARPVWPLKSISFRNRTVLVLSLLLAVGVLLRIFLGPLFPPVDMDECRTHLPIARAFLSDRVAVFHPEITFSTQPQNIEMLYVWAIAWSPLSAAHFLNFIAFIFSLLTLVCLGRVVFSLKTGWLAALIMGTMAIMQNFGSIASPSMWILFYVLAGALAIAEGIQDRSVIRIMLGGTFLGAAAGAGYIGLLASLSLALSLVALGRIKGMTTLIPRWGVIPSVVFFLLASFAWYLRNLNWFANPVFPFYDSNLPPGGGIHGVYGAEIATRIVWLFQNETAGALWRDGLFWPKIVTLWSVWIGIPAGILFVRTSPFTRIAIIWTLLVWLFWMIPGHGIMHLTYFLFLIPFNVLILANLLGSIYSMPPGNRGGRFFRIVLWVLLIGWVGIAGARTSQLVPPLTGSRIGTYLNRMHGSYGLVTAANKVIAKDRKAVGILCEDGRIYADFRLLGGNAGWANLRILADSSTSARELADLILERYGADYLIIHENRLRDTNSTSANSLRHLTGTAEFKRYFHEVARVGDGAVYLVDLPD